MTQLPLTDRHLQIIRLVCDGLGNKEIAAQLFISEGTVKQHLKTIYQRLGLRPYDAQRYHLIFWGVRNGIIKPERMAGVDWANPSLWPEPETVETH